MTPETRLEGDAPPSKRCFRCGDTKALSEFYRHPQMSDGHLNKCKECTKADTRKTQQRPGYTATHWKYQRKYRAKHPDRHRARQATWRAIDSGRLVRQPCEICADPKSEAHHDDYSKPLEVRWLCMTHHRLADSARRSRERSSAA